MKYTNQVIITILITCTILSSSCDRSIVLENKGVDQLFELYLENEDLSFQSRIVNLLEDSLTKHSVIKYFNPQIRVNEIVDSISGDNIFSATYIYNEDTEYKINKRNILVFHLTKTDDIVFENDTINHISELNDIFSAFFSNPTNSPRLPEKVRHIASTNDTFYVVKQGIFINTSVYSDSSSQSTSWALLKNVVLDITSEYNIARDSISDIVFQAYYDELDVSRKREILGFLPTRIHILLNRIYPIKPPRPPEMNWDSIIDANSIKDLEVQLKEIIND